MIFDTVSKEVEKEKIKAIGARNLLKSYAKQRESQQEQLRALVVEKKTELDRLNTQHAALAKVTPITTSLPYFGVKLSCVCLMSA